MAYIPAIDGLRAVAILIVVFSHFTGGRWIPGGLGVTLFFFISGYLITSLLCIERRDNETIHLVRFYIRRFRRLAPALIFMVVTVAVVYAIFEKRFSANEISAGLLYFINYYQIYGGTMPLPIGTLWSLAVEEHFYLMFPLIVGVLLPFGRRFLIGLAAACFVVLIWRTWLVYHGASEYRTYIATDTRIDSILFGCLLAVASDLKLDLNWLQSPAIIASACFLMAISLAYRNEAFRETLRYSLQGLAILPLFYWSVFGTSAPIKSILQSQPSTWIGKISYSLYLWHFPVLAFCAERIGLPMSLFAAAALSSLIAAFSYYYIETPLRSTRIQSLIAR